MQDILLEPYGGEILGLSVSATTGLTALLAGGMLIAFGLSSRVLGKGGDPVRLAAYGAVVGVFAFAAVLLAAPLDSPMLFRLGTFFIGFGSGLFSIGTLTAAMNLSDGDQAGLAIGAWGAVQATMTGLAIAFGGGLRDVFTHFAASGHLGSVAMHPSTGYGVVYLLEIVILFAALISIGPLVQGSREIKSKSKEFRLAEFPG
jgi:BCD family chlorophyll transporter-like MFS transporter